MKFAKKAGWEMVVGSICLILCLIITHFTKMVFDDVIILGVRPFAIAMDIISIPLWVFLAITLFYAVWGLLCGYDQTEWNNYVENSQRNDRMLLRKMLDNDGVEYPSWLPPKENE
jgi:hypothetical protein